MVSKYIQIPNQQPPGILQLLKIDDGVFEVKATSGDTYLCEKDFENSLVEYSCIEFQKKQGIDLRLNAKALRRLRNQCERAKRILSSVNQTSIEINTLAEKEDFNCSMTRGLKNCVSINLNNIFFLDQDLKYQTQIEGMILNIILQLIKQTKRN